MSDHKLAAIVFTDIVGYTRKMESDEDGTMKLLSRQRELVFPLVKEFGGEVIKEIGDGLLIMFSSAKQAVRFAITVQERLKNDELTIRAGIHIGDVIFEKGDVFGSAVNIAARIEPLATAGGICISEDVRRQVRNQGDIKTSSVGKKELKGVNEEIEIHRVLTSEVTDAQIKLPFYKDLWQRRVFQITGIYLLVSYLMKLGMGFLVNEYLLSPHLVNLIWFILLSLIPSIILVSYFHGRKGINKWTRVELVGLPLNIVIAFLVLVFVFKGKELGAITTKLTLQNEDGENIEKLVIKNEFRKKILLFNMENVSGDTALDYLQYGITEMTEYDLSQDLFITPASAMGIYLKLVDAGFQDAVGLPITLMKHFAEQQHMNYFMYGDLDRIEDKYVINVKLYDARLTRLISEISVQDESPFDLVDKLSIEIKRAMGLPESHISETIDLPVSEMFTSSETALYYFTMSLKENVLNNWTENIRLLELAIEDDPGFALAYVTVTLSYFNVSDVNKAQGALQYAMDLLYKLTERQQFVVKYLYYVFGQEPEKALNIVKMWVDLYPDDLMAHMTLAERYTVRNMIHEAINEHKEILRLDPERYETLSTLGDFYLHLGDLDSALVYYQGYANNLPQQIKSYRKLGKYYLMTGDVGLAKENFEKALLLADATEKVSVKIDLANIELKRGNFDLAHDQYYEALGSSKTASDSASVFGALQELYSMQGLADKALESFELKIDKYRSYQPPKNVMVHILFSMETYVYAGELDRAFRILEEIEAKLDPPLSNVVPFGYLSIYAETGDTAKASEAISGAEDLIKGFGEELLMQRIYYAQGKLNELRGEYQDAIDNYKECLEMNPGLYALHCNIARCHRYLGDLKKAKKEIQISLQHQPFDPINNYEAALLYLEKGDRERGLEFLEKAVEIWKNADSDYQKASLAKEKLKTLKDA